MKKFLLLFVFFISASVYAGTCDKVRKEFKFHGYKSDVTQGWYTNMEVGTKRCKGIDIDHVVSLKEACNLGLPKERWVEFANDRENHVPSCSSVSRSKGASGPEDFLKKSQDGKGVDYNIIKYEEYLEIYYRILEKYNLQRN